MKKLRNTDKGIEIYFSFNRKIVKGVREIPGRIYNELPPYWLVNLTPHNVEYFIKFCIDHSFDVSEEIIQECEKLEVIRDETKEQQKQNLITSSAEDSDIRIHGLKGKLIPYQKVGVLYGSQNRKIINGDSMGLGKTIQTIATIHYTNQYPALVICPNSLKHNWEREYHKWTDKQVLLVNTSNKLEKLILDEFDVMIMNYGSLVKFIDTLVKFNWNSLVADESHYLKNNKAKRTKAFKKIAKVVRKKEESLILELTGTAITNKPAEIISQLDILGKLGDFGGWWNFAKRYCKAHHGAFGLDISGASNLEELHTKLRSICYLRRDKKDVLKELPDKQYSIIEVDIDNRKEYNEAKGNVIEFLKESIESKEVPSELIEGLSEEEKACQIALFRLKQRSNYEIAEAIVQINTLKKVSANGKMKEVVDWIKDFLESGEKIVLFTTHKDIINNLVDIFNCNKIDGDIKIEDRQKYVDDFQENPNTKLIVLNIKAGGVGLTLTAASHLGFIELGWTPAEHMQAEDRIHRIGQKNAVNIYYFLGKDTIDNDIYQLLEEKRVITDAVNAGEFSDEKSSSILRDIVNKLLN